MSRFERLFHTGPGALRMRLIGTKLKLQASLDFLDQDPIDYRIEHVAEGLRLFEKVFGFPSVSFIPPNFVSDSTVLDTSVCSGVKAIRE